MWPIEQSQLRLKGENTHYCWSISNDLILHTHATSKDEVDDHRTPDVDLMVYRGQGKSSQR